MTASLADFHFLRPWWLAAFVPLAVLLWQLAHHRLRGGSWEAVCDSALLPFVLMSRSGERRRWPLYVAALGGSLAVLALAGPAWERLPQPVYRAQSPLAVVLDLSRSMDAGDIKPSRLARARFKVADILERRKEGQTALVVYAGDAYTVTPLTDDTATIGSQLPALSTEIMPTQGSRASTGIDLAARLLEQAGNKKGEILLITDGVDPAKAASSAQALSDSGYRLSVLGVGTEDGAPIPKPGGGFLSDYKGAIVLPTLDTQALQDLAAAGGGLYAPLSVGDGDLNTLLSQTERWQELGETSGLEANVWREQGPWLLLLLLPMAALAFRRGILVLLLLTAIPVPEPAQALDWSSFWLRADQQGDQALSNGDAERAAELFRDPAWKGTASYRAGKYDDTVDALEGLDDATSHYNRGNALARQGSYQEAVAAYDETLEREAGHEDARYNRDLLQELLDQQQQQQQQQEPENQEGEQQQSQRSPSGGQEQGEDEEQRPGEQQQSSQQPSDDGSESDSTGDQAAQNAATDQNGDETKEDAGQQVSGDEQPDSSQEQSEAQQASAAESAGDESEQAAEQWLRRIPDDPAGLLRRKFRYQYGQRKPASRDEDDKQEW